jgi:lipopolysaccharide transport system permease protein
VAGLDSGEVPYALIVLTGVLPWYFFSSIVSEAGTSLVANSSLISKVYFPKLVIPVSVVIANAFDFVISIILIGATILVTQGLPSINVLYMPVMMSILILFSIACGLWVSALNAKYRDVQYLIPFALTIGQYVCPIGYATKAVPETWMFLYQLNPLAVIIEGFRWCLVGVGDFNWYGLMYSLVFTIILLISGIRYFNMVERHIVDTI